MGIEAAKFAKEVNAAAEDDEVADEDEIEAPGLVPSGPSPSPRNKGDDDDNESKGGIGACRTCCMRFTCSKRTARSRSMSARRASSS